jgi:hypothetical protein
MILQLKAWFWARISKDWATSVLFFFTAIAAAVAFILLWGAGLFRPAGYFLCLEDLEHVGAFVGGIFTPIAVGWAARTFLLQQQQMVQTLDAMHRQNELARVALEQTNAQLRIEAERELASNDPVLDIITAAVSTPLSDGVVYTLTIKNEGQTALQLMVTIELVDSSVGPGLKLQELAFQRTAPLGKGKHWDFHPKLFMQKLQIPQKFEATMTIRVQRTDGLISKFTYRAKDALTFAFIEARRADPALTMN